MIPFEELDIKAVEKIDIDNGDVLAVYVNGRHSMEELEKLKQELSILFLPKKVNVIVLNYELVKMQVIRPAGDEK